MLKIILCPIDFSDLSRQEIQLAVRVCEAFGGHLVLHHNLTAPSPGFSNAWQWDEEHRGARSEKADERMRALLAEVPKTVSVEASISTGPLGTVLLEMARKLPADLMVIGSHGWSTEDHASVTERVIDNSPCAVLTLHEGIDVGAQFRLQPAAAEQAVPVVVPTDFSPSAERVVAYAFDLARRLPVRLFLLHVGPRASAGPATEAARYRLQQLVAPDMQDRTECHVVQGEPIDEILAFSERAKPAFMVMGEHARGFFRRLLTRDTAREVLHRAPCPVWFVPPGKR